MKNLKTQQTVIGIDLGDKKHAICVLGKNGETLKEFTLSNNRKNLEWLAKEYPGSLMAMEVGTHSPWISRLLKSKGPTVLVANARKLRAIYNNERKCDRVDARMLARLARVDPELLHPVHHGTEQNQRDLLSIKLRDSLVRQRVNIVGSIRDTLKSLGLKLTKTSTSSFTKRARIHLEDLPDILAMIEPSLKAVDELTTRIVEYEQTITNAAKRYPQTEKLRKIAGVGPITALSFVLKIEDPNQFHDPRDVGAYLGLVPRRDQSGDSDKELPISKTGDRYLRGLLVQCSQYILGHHGPDCDLRRHGLRLATRGGKAAKKKAVIAVARKLAVLMLVLWKKQGDYQPFRNSPDHAQS